MQKIIFFIEKFKKYLSAQLWSFMTHYDTQCNFGNFGAWLVYYDNINPLMPKRYVCISYLIFSFKKQMLEGGNSDLFNPLVPKAHNSECQNLPFPLQINPVKIGEKP